MHHHHKTSASSNGIEDPKPPAPNQALMGSASKQNPLVLSQAMMSQDSIQHYVEDAEKEAILERRRLQIQEAERKKFANQIISQSSFQDEEDAPNHSHKTFLDHALAHTKNGPKSKFGRQNDGLTKKERLEDLLQKTEQYTRFILQQNMRHHRAQQKSQFAADILQGKLDSDAAKANGKASLSKRRQKKGKGQADGGSSDDDNETAITRLTVQPTILKGPFKLRDYQLDGLNWMISLFETGLNGILADEMGLGKTIQTISLVSFLKEFKQVNGYHLIIMPKSVVGNWMQEFKRWMPCCRVVNLIARKEAREDILRNELQAGKFDVCITTFEGVRICMSALMKFNWEYIIIDEAHKIKNEDSQTSKRIRQFNSKYRLLLTGTPLQNNLHELWALLNFLLPEIFKSSDDFDEWFDLGSKANDNLSDAEKEKKNNEMIKQLHKILRPFMLRRIKREVEKSLLPKIEMHINVGITETQKSIYRQLLKTATIEKGNSTSHFKNILMQLRKVCNHPYLFPGIEADDAPELGDHLIKVSGKMQVLDKLLKKARADKSQTLIFSGFTSMLDILEDYCRFREYPYCRLDGNTELDDRQAQIDDYTSPDTNKFVFLISTRAGGLGLNLMTANTVVLFDSDWNPQMDLQAMDRAHRIGQQKQVYVYRLITKNTMEEKMVEKQTMKLKLDSLIIQKGRLAPKNTSFQKDDLQDMVNYGADAIFEIGSNIDDEDIEQLIKEGEDKAKNLAAQAEEVMKEKFSMLNFEMNSCNLYQFEDVDYLKEKRKEAEDALKQNVIALMETETNLTSRRKFQKSLAESSLCPNIFGNGNIGVSNEAKKKKLAKVQDFRFFPNPERLKELIEMEMESKFAGYIQGMNVQVFTPELKIEKDLIEAAGFPEWDRRDYQKFIQGLELFATTDYESISKHMEGTKTPAEVRKYAIVFFEKVDTLNDADKIKAKINKAQKNVNFNMRAPGLIKNKLKTVEDPYDDLQLPHATQKSKFFNRETDILLLVLTNRLGFGNWSKLKKAVCRESRCRMDHLFTSRSEEELKKRVIYLVQCLDKEEEEARNKPKKAAQKPSVADLEAQFQKLMLEAEERANEAMANLTATSIVRLANQGLDKLIGLENKNDTSNIQESQATDSIKDNKSKTTKKDVESVTGIDKEMMDEMADDYDKQTDTVQVAKPKNGKKKAQPKKKAKDQDSIMSEDSGIRAGQDAHHSKSAAKYNEEELEEDEILERELGGGARDSESDIPKSSSKSPLKKQEPKVLEMKEPASQTGKRMSQRSKPAPPSKPPAAASKQGPVSASTKSTKQSNIADWMNNTASAQKNLVGQKRVNREASNERPSKGKQAKPEDVSEFNVDE